MCRLHAALAELAPGGIAKELNASDAEAFLDQVEPGPRSSMFGYELALELLGRRAPPRRPAQGLPPPDPRRGPRVEDVAHRPVRCRADHRVYRSSATPATSAGSANRDQFAAYNGTAPVEVSSGGRIMHRLVAAGNRRLNHAIHMAAVTQVRHAHSEGRAYFDRKLAEGKTKKEALRALKRQVSNAVYRQLLVDASADSGPGRTEGATRSQRGRLTSLNPALRRGHSRTQHGRMPCPTLARAFVRAPAPKNDPLESKRLRTGA